MAVFGIAGVLVLLVGIIGEWCGKLIKAAVSRQREFLADASAVQFTRNPAGITGALRKIGGHTLGARVNARGAEEASHFFFGDIGGSFMAFPELFATHPSLRERIRRFDPAFEGEFPALADGVAEPADGVLGALAPGADRVSSAHAAFAPEPGHVVGHVGSSDRSALAHGKRLLQALPPELREAAREPYSACALVYALLLSEDGAVRGLQLEQLARTVGAGLTYETQRCAGLLISVHQRDRLPLVELLAPALQALSAAQRTAFNAVVKQLIAADERMSIFEYVVAHTLERSGQPRQPQGARKRSLALVRGELELLLSLLAYAGAANAEQAAQAFAAGAAQLSLSVPGLTLLPASHRLLSALWPALDALRGLPPLLCAQVVDACAHAVLSGSDVNENEWTLLRAVCSALECPLPPSWP
jgi:hypothetical protein